jgi:hypothetical protein
METWKRSIKFIKYIVEHDNFDSLIVIFGDVGLGKSTLGYLTGKEFSSEFSSDNIAPDTQEFTPLISKFGQLGKKGTVLMVDEGQWGSYSREAMKKSNRDFNKRLMTIRGLNFIIIVIIPDFFSLDAYIRKFRVMVALRVRGEPAHDFEKAMAEKKPLIERGRFEVFSRDKIKKMWKDRDKGIEHYPSPSYQDSYEYVDPEKEPEWKRYLVKKNAFMISKGGAEKDE